MVPIPVWLKALINGITMSTWFYYVCVGHHYMRTIQADHHVWRALVHSLVLHAPNSRINGNFFRGINLSIILWHLVQVRTFGIMYDHTFSKLANHQIRHQAKHKVGCQPGDYIWSLKSSSGVCVDIYELPCSFYHRFIIPEGWIYLRKYVHHKEKNAQSQYFMMFILIHK